MAKIAYYVFVESINNRKIEKYNVLTEGIVAKIKERTEGISDKAQFAEEVSRLLRYYYWAKCEWEITITEWPARVTPDEVLRLSNEIETYQKKYNKTPYSLDTRLRVDEKIDVYTQIMLNWDIFINYVWENLR